jgi:hypothetical protein
VLHGFIVIIIVFFPSSSDGCINFQDASFLFSVFSFVAYCLCCFKEASSRRL